MLREVDVAIIGAGSAGLFALSQVRKQTDSFVLIDGGELGTTCARVGCMPSKAMIQVGEDFHRRSLFEREGINGGDGLSIDTATSMEHVQDLRDTFVDRTLGATDSLDETHLIQAYAHFISADTLQVGDEQIKARAIVIATGSSPVVPAAWQALGDRIVTSDEIFELESLPASMAVIGLGVIGLELGQALQRMGVEVTAFDMLESIAGVTDPEVQQQIQAAMGRQLHMHLGVAAELSAEGEQVRVKAGDTSVVVDKVLASLGRKPNLDSLQLQHAGITLDDNGIPDFDPHTMRIGDSNVFIAGDVTADRPILHEAGHDGRIAGNNAMRLANGEAVRAYRRKTAMAITFCDPNIATVGQGLDELDADKIAIGSMQMAPVGRALIMGNNRGLIRVYVNKADGLLLGASLVCAKAENLAHLLAWSIEQGLTVFDMLRMPFYHPVIEEALQAALYSVLGELDVKQELVELEELKAM